MVLIREVVQQALATGYLTIAAETRLRQLLTTHYDQEDLNAFMKLQLAAMSGQVRQEARELRQLQCSQAAALIASKSFSCAHFMNAKADELQVV